MTSRLLLLRRDSGGATVIEYALLASCLSIALISAISMLQSKTGDVFTNVFTSQRMGQTPGGSNQHS